MVEHWQRSGLPTYMAVSGYLGLIKPDKDAPAVVNRDAAPGSDEAKYGNLDELAAMFADSGGMIGA